MHQSVILIHTLPDESSHFDWLIDQPLLSQDHRLISFRCSFRPDQSDVHSFTAIAMPLHRAKYLTYEGPISQSRGSVKQVAAGIVEYLSVDQHQIQLRIQWNHATIEYLGECKCQDDRIQWHFHAQPSTNQLDETT